MKLLNLIFEESIASNPTSESPLHIAALLGHTVAATTLLNQNPSSAKTLNSNGSSPLHIAAANGSTEIVKELTLVSPDSCLILDFNGRSPVHLAAIKGRVEVLSELIRVKPEAIRVLTSQGETSLHLCVKNSRFDALKVLVESMQRDDEFVNWKDSDGNTVLHLAVANKQILIIKFLLDNSNIQVNARNINGLASLDVLSQGPRDIRDMEIKNILHRAGASRITETKSLNHISTQPIDPNLYTPTAPHKHRDWLAKKRSALSIVASLIATVAFQAVVTPPGGVWQDDIVVDEHGITFAKLNAAGTSVMAYRIPKAYDQFMIVNTLAFLSSLSIILLLISGLPLTRRRWMWAQMVITWIAITSQASTYFIALLHMTPEHVQGVLFHVTGVSVLVWLVVMGAVFVGNVIRVIVWLLRKYGILREKQRKRTYIEEEEEDEL